MIGSNNSGCDSCLKQDSFQHSFHAGLDETSPVAFSNGKFTVVDDLRTRFAFEKIAMIGDGKTDLEVKENDQSVHFLAFTEHISRASVVDKADYVMPNFTDYVI